LTFQDLVAGWHDFYTISGTAAATLVGLLFVGLSLHLRAVLSRAEMRSLARVTLTNFALLLLLALFISVPQDAASASLDLVVIGAVSLAVSVPSLAAAARSPTRTLRLTQLVMRFGFSTVSYAVVVVSGVLLAAGSFSTALYSLVGSTVTLFVVSLRNSWDLLVGLGAVIHSVDPSGHEGAADATISASPPPRAQ
jgi:hypothetical protein